MRRALGFGFGTGFTTRVGVEFRDEGWGLVSGSDYIKGVGVRFQDGVRVGFWGWDRDSRQGSGSCFGMGFGLGYKIGSG